MYLFNLNRYLIQTLDIRHKDLVKVSSLISQKTSDQKPQSISNHSVSTVGIQQMSHWDDLKRMASLCGDCLPPMGNLAHLFMLKPQSLLTASFFLNNPACDRH